MDTLHHLGYKDFLLLFYKPSRGKRFLRVSSKALFLTVQQLSHPVRPSALCLKLRKHLKNAILERIEQQGSERVVRLLFRSKEEKYCLFVEVFSSGNLVLTDSELKILAVAGRSEGKTRSTVVGSTYMLPPQQFNSFSLTAKVFFTILQRSSLPVLVKALARDLGLGGRYAEELCFLASVDKQLQPHSLTSSQSASLWKALRTLLALPIQAVVWEMIALPFALHDTGPGQSYPSFNAALDAASLEEKKQPAQLVRLQRRIAQQEEAIALYEQEIEQASSISNSMYEQYAAISALLSLAALYRKSHDAAHLRQLKQHPFFVGYDEKKSLLTLRLPEDAQ